MSSKNYEANGYRYGLDLLILTLIACFISYEKCREKSMQIPYVFLRWSTAAESHATANEPKCDFSFLGAKTVRK